MRWQSPMGDQFDPKNLRQDHSELVGTPCNFYSGMKLQWSVSVNNGCLQVSLGVRHAEHDYSVVKHGISQVFDSIASCYLIEGCRHEQDTKLDEPDRFSKFTGPVFLVTQRDETAAPINNREQDVGEVASTIGSPGSAMEMESDPSDQRTTQTCRLGSSGLQPTLWALWPSMDLMIYASSH